MPTAIVSNIQGYSIHDGPGIRTTVFLQGCPLRCRWCANPENLEAKPKVGFLRTLCGDCLRCLEACREGAIRREAGGYRLQQALCSACGDCIPRCPRRALVLYGRETEAEEVYRQVRKDKMFYDASDGGVTLSGGEAMLYPEFAAALFRLLGAEGIHRCIETCGDVPRAHFEALLPLTDLFLYDLKHPDPEQHLRWTGRDNRRILENARFLAEQGAPLHFRQPLIPGVNDNEANIRQTAEFLHSLPGDRAQLELMPYHRAGKAKYEALDLVYETADLLPHPKEELERVRSSYEALGIACSVSA